MVVKDKGYEDHKNRFSFTKKPDFIKDPIINKLIEESSSKTEKNENLTQKIPKQIIEAIVKKNLHDAKRLILSGIDVNTKDEYGMNALMYAAKYGHKEIVELLINNGVDVNHQDKEHWTALMYASWGGHKEIVKILIDNGADIAIENNKGATALILAARRGYKEIVELLINNGANINHQDKHGRTALMYSSWNGYKEIVELLIERGANLSIRSKSGETPLTYVYDDETMEILTKAGLTDFGNCHYKRR